MIKIVSLHVTNRCNSKCRHCFVDGGQSKFEEMTTDQIKKFIDEFAIASEGKGRINVFGGEPLIRDDIYEIIEYTHEKGLEIELATGGVVTDDRIQKLIEARPDYMSFDLDGGTAESHDWLRNNPGHFERMKKIIQRFIDASIYTNIVMVVNNMNRKEVGKFLDICKELKVQESTLQFFNAMGRGKLIEDLVVNAADWLETKGEVEKWINENNPEFTIAWQKAYMNKNDDLNEKVWDCKTENTERLFLRTNGEVYRCALLYGSDMCIGNVKEESFLDILKRFNENKYVCKNIKGCPAISWHTNGSPLEDDPRDIENQIEPTCPREREYYTF